MLQAPQKMAANRQNHINHNGTADTAARNERQQYHLSHDYGTDSALSPANDPVILTKSEATTNQPHHSTKPVTSSTFDAQLAATVSLLIFATIWGVLTRLGLTWIGGFSSSVVFPLIWAQMVGCFVMGANTERRTDVEAW